MRAPLAIMTALLVAAHAAPAPGPDDVSVGGTAANVHVGAHDARVVDVLAVLAQRFNLRVHGPVGDRRVSADFDGSLRRVIAYLLDGYDYIVRMRGDELEVTVLSAASSHAAPAPVYAPPTHPVAKLRRDE
jgi:hypothetical protein